MLLDKEERRKRRAERREREMIGHIVDEDYNEEDDEEEEEERMKAEMMEEGRARPGSDHNHNRNQGEEERDGPTAHSKAPGKGYSETTLPCPSYICSLTDDCNDNDGTAPLEISTKATSLSPRHITLKLTQATITILKVSLHEFSLHNFRLVNKHIMVTIDRSLIQSPPESDEPASEKTTPDFQTDSQKCVGESILWRFDTNDGFTSSDFGSNPISLLPTVHDGVVISLRDSTDPSEAQGVAYVSVFDMLSTPKQDAIIYKKVKTVDIIRNDIAKTCAVTLLYEVHRRF
jgi:hypothetical protein